MTARIKAALLVALVFQLLWHGMAAREGAGAQALQDPPSLIELRLASLGESVMASRLTMLYLQSFDIQPGIIIPYRDLDYKKVEDWLEVSQDLDERDAYPLFAASGLYLEVNDPGRKRRMLDFIYREFLKNPEARWPWLARGVLAAKYGLHDLPLAFNYAEALGKASNLPAWAREMPVFLLEDMNEFESAKIWLGGLLVSGKIKDGNEILFLKKELENLENREQKKPSMLW